MSRASIREQIDGVPKAPGVYQWIRENGDVIYIGKANDLRQRLLGHFNSPMGHKSWTIVEESTAIDFIVVKTQKEALILEQTLIKKLKPRYNVRLTDGKGYPYLKLTREPYPRLLKVHQYVGDGGTYFGPFPDGYGAFQVHQALLDLFPIRRCKVLPKEKCLYYDIGKCIAPCIDACEDAEYEALVQEIRGILRGNVRPILNRLHKQVQAHAEKGQYELAAVARDRLASLQGVLEKQHVFVDRIEDRDVIAIDRAGPIVMASIVHVREGHMVGQESYQLDAPDATELDEILQAYLMEHYTARPCPRTLLVDAGAVTLEELQADLSALKGEAITVQVPQRGDGRRWLEIAKHNATLRCQEEFHRRKKRGEGSLEVLRSHLNLPRLPQRIEGFDISHSAGRFTRSAMVVFLDGEPSRKHYRTFNMRDVGEHAIATGTATRTRGIGREIDDFLSMEEAVTRRMRPENLQDWGEPDLLVIDGGMGQLQAARKALQATGMDHVSICSLAKKEELVYLPGRLHPLRLKREDTGLQLLQRVRDESHRFGIQQVRQKATRSVLESPLDHIEGLGIKRRQALLKAFDGLRGLEQASEAEIRKVPGIGPDLARRIHAYFVGKRDATSEGAGSKDSS